MRKLLFLLVISLFVVGCTNSDRAYDVLSKQGYTNITTGGHAWFSCSDDDTFATNFTATSPSGSKVRGAVCSGLFKGNTIRFD